MHPGKVDIHTHIIPEHIPRWAEKFNEKGYIHLDHHKHCRARMMIDDKFFREIEDNCWDPKVRMHQCDKHGVGVQVLSTIPVLFNYWAKAENAYDTARFFNDHISSVVRNYPERFIGLGTLPLQSPELSVKELERCVKELGLPGVEIGSHINDWNLNSPQLFPVYEAAQELDAAIFVHPWDMMGKEKMPDYWLPWLVGMPAETSLAICSMIFGGVFEKFPNLRVAFAHGGGAFPSSIGRIQHGFDVRPDLVAVHNKKPPKDYLGKFWLDSLVHDRDMLEYIMKLKGEYKICLGSDYPFPLGEHHPGKLIESMNLSPATQEKLLRSNALEWLGRSYDSDSVSAGNVGFE